MPLHDLAVKVDNNHIVRGHSVIQHPGRLDDDKAGLRVPSGQVARGPRHKSMTGQFEVASTDVCLELFKHEGFSFEQ
jgi:hypothetical protein